MSRPKGCGTCRDRRVRCDRTTPECTRCVKSKKTCDGYAVRLSWPRDNDQKRAMVAPPPHGGVPASRPCEATFVQTTSWDIEMHYHFSVLGRDAGNKKYFAIQPVIAPSVRWLPHRLDTSQNELLEYFAAVASGSLTSVGHNAAALRGTLVRLAFSSNTPASAAVLQSLLALSSLHRYGPLPQAARHKLTALRQLTNSCDRGLESEEMVQHIAAGMLLASFEIQNPNETTADWIWYVCGSKSMISQGIVQNKLPWQESDFLVTLGWVHYYAVLAGFSLRHWRGHSAYAREYRAHSEPRAELQKEGQYAVNMEPSTELWLRNMSRKLPYPSGPSHKILHFLSEVYESVVHPSNPIYATEEYRNHLQILAWRLRKITIASPEKANIPEESCMLRITQLYQLSALVYLERSAARFANPSENLNQIVDKAFSILGKLETCQWPFPLLIFSCEAHMDDQRIIIMDLISRTERKGDIRSLDCLKNMIRLVWVQDDLASGELDYIDRMSAILSTSDSVPTFI